LGFEAGFEIRQRRPEAVMHSWGSYLNTFFLLQIAYAIIFCFQPINFLKNVTHISKKLKESKNKHLQKILRVHTIRSSPAPVKNTKKHKENINLISIRKYKQFAFHPSELKKRLPLRGGI